MEGLRDDHSETFEMALNTWDEQCEAEMRQDEISSESEHGTSTVAAASRTAMTRIVSSGAIPPTHRAWPVTGISAYDSI